MVLAWDFADFGYFESEKGWNSRFYSNKILAQIAPRSLNKISLDSSTRFCYNEREWKRTP